MVTFIIRRLIASVFLLIIVAMITFAIFFLLPRLAGQSTYALATQYVGRNPTHAAVLAVEQQLGLNRPLYLQFGSFLKAIVLGKHDVRFDYDCSSAIATPSLKQGLYGPATAQRYSAGDRGDIR